MTSLVATSRFQETAPGDPWALEKAHLVAEIKSRDAEIQRWTLLAERCGEIFGSWMMDANF